MKAVSKKIPSGAQARVIARLFGDGPLPHWPDRNVTTMGVVVREGWAQPTGEEKEAASGAVAKLYEASNAGLWALSLYIRANIEHPAVTADKERKAAGRA